MTHHAAPAPTFMKNWLSESPPSALLVLFRSARAATSGGETCPFGIDTQLHRFDKWDPPGSLGPMAPGRNQAETRAETRVRRTRVPGAVTW